MNFRDLVHALQQFLLLTYHQIYAFLFCYVRMQCNRIPLKILISVFDYAIILSVLIAFEGLLFTK
jgi:hypothetical protein